MEKPNLSPEFTMSDLYMLREYNSLKRVGMSTKELINDIDKGANKAIERITQLRKDKYAKA